MMHSLKYVTFAIVLTLAGCSNPADDKFQSTASAPKPEGGASAPAPAPSASAAPADSKDKAAVVAETLALPSPGSSALAFSSADSKVGFVGSKVTGSHTGGFNAFKGFIEPTPDGKDAAKIAVEIDMNSTFTDNEKLTAHLKNQDFFDVPKFPKALFVTTDIKPATDAEKAKYKEATHSLTGNLTLHGVTKSITFPAKVEVKDGKASLASEFALNRKDFGITMSGMANDLIRDEVVIKLAITAPEKKA
jgi:polyisoprenoid-binding protein YceI